MTQSLTVDSSEIHLQIINGVAALKNTDFLELPPLYDAIDPDALEAIFAGERTGTIRFPYAGCAVTVKFDDESTVLIE